MTRQEPSGHHEKSPSTLADILKSRREATGLTRTELAKKLGISRSQLTRLETGQAKRPAPALVGRIAEVLGVRLADLQAITGYIPSTDLPDFRPYLRAIHPDWPDEAIIELAAYHDYQRYKYSAS